MRMGCSLIAILLFGFIGYGLYLSWGINIVIVYVAVVAFLSMVLYYRLKPEPAATKEPKENHSESSVRAKSVLQDPDTLLQQFRTMHQQNHDISSDDHLNGYERKDLLLDEDDAAFKQVVEELKKVNHDKDSLRMKWITHLEKETKQFAEKSQFKTNDPMMKRINVLFIMNGFLYLRVFVNLIDISIKMKRLDQSYAERLDLFLANLSRSEYERLNRVIVLHYLDLFLSDHMTAVLFNDTFSRRMFSQSVMEGLGFGKRETLMLQAIKTDTEYIKVLLEQVRIESDKLLVDLAKTAFENTLTPLKEKLVSEMSKPSASN